MTENEKKGVEKQREYQFDKIPKNVRQIGEQQGGTRYYIEDYVITYMEEMFEKNPEGTLLILIGKRGWAEAENHLFVYGSIKIETTLERGVNGITKELWDGVIQQSAEFFPEGQILGWACSISIGNSQNEENRMQIHKKCFGQNSPLCFLKNSGDKEEYLYCWKDNTLQKIPGYMIFYANNPQMQEYVLQGTPQKSMEADYCDTVTKNVRSVIAKKNEKKWNRRILRYAAGIAMAGAFFVAAYMLIEGKEKIHSLESTVSTLSRKTSVQSDVADSEENKVRRMEEKMKEPEMILDAEKYVADKVTQSPDNEKKEESKNTQNKDEKGKKTKKKSRREGKKEKKTVSSPTFEPDEPKGCYYEVVEGDTLSQIVWRQYRDMDYIEIVKEANGIENSNQIKAGEKLLLPPSL